MLYAALPDNAKDSPLFFGLSESEKEALFAEGRIRSCTRGQALFVHSAPVTHFFLIITGAFQLFRTNAEGHEKTIAIAKSGQTMCENEILDSCHNHRTNAMSLEESVVMAFPVAWLKETARKHSIFALNLLSLVAQHAHIAEVEAEHHATMTSPQLLACFLQRLCILYHLDPKGFNLPYSKTLIASRLGMELETFSRTLAKLKEQGIIVDGTRVIIADLVRINAYVCGVCSVSEECTTNQAMEKIADSLLKGNQLATSA